MNLLQRSDCWVANRIGKITASRIKDLNAKPKKGEALNATMTKLLTERLTGIPQESGFISKCMEWGIDNEPFAIAEYENLNNVFVVQTGLIMHPTIPMSGASPDGLVGDDGQIEVKCPNSTTHTNTRLTGEIPSEYIPQITWQLAVTGRDWCDFVSYDPRFDPTLSLFVKRVYAKDLDIAGLEKQVIECNKTLDELIEKLTTIKGAIPCAE